MLSYRLRERVTLQAPVQEQDELGEPVHRWLDVTPLWAEIIPISGREHIAAQGLQNPVSVKIVLRHQARLAASLRPALRIRHHDAVYNIEAVLLPASAEIHLWCSTGIQGRSNDA